MGKRDVKLSNVDQHRRKIGRYENKRGEQVRKKEEKEKKSGTNESKLQTLLFIVFFAFVVLLFVYWLFFSTNVRDATLYNASPPRSM